MPCARALHPNTRAPHPAPRPRPQDDAAHFAALTSKIVMLEEEHEELREHAAGSEARLAELQGKFVAAQAELQQEAAGLQQQVGAGGWGRGGRGPGGAAWRHAGGAAAACGGCGC
jgi:hypothetical protein